MKIIEKGQEDVGYITDTKQIYEVKLFENTQFDKTLFSNSTVNYYLAYAL